MKTERLLQQTPITNGLAKSSIGTANGDHVALFNRKLIERPYNVSLILLGKHKSCRHTVYANRNIG